jgi:dTMP kinase
MEGVFLVMEGPDGSGTTTQVDRLADFLRREGYSVEVTTEPTDGEYGQVVKEMISGEYFESDISEEEKARRIAEEFVKDRKQHQKHVKENLKDNDFVISDRYYHSTYAYQQTHGISFEEIEQLHQEIIGDELRVPDLTLILCVGAETGMERISERGKEKAIFESEGFQKQVLKQYKNLKNDLDEQIEYVDSDQTITEVSEEIQSILKQKEYIDFTE